MTGLQAGDATFGLRPKVDLRKLVRRLDSSALKQTISSLSWQRRLTLGRQASTPSSTSTLYSTIGLPPSSRAFHATVKSVGELCCELVCSEPITSNLQHRCHPVVLVQKEKQKKLQMMIQYCKDSIQRCCMPTVEMNKPGYAPASSL